MNAAVRRCGAASVVANRHCQRKVVSAATTPAMPPRSAAGSRFVRRASSATTTLTDDDVLYLPMPKLSPSMVRTSSCSIVSIAIGGTPLVFNCNLLQLVAFSHCGSTVHGSGHVVHIDCCTCTLLLYCWTLLVEKYHSHKEGEIFLFPPMLVALDE